MLTWVNDTTLVALIGLVSGCVLGLAARVGRFCTLGAIEDLLYGNSARRMWMWGLTITVAITGSFALMAAELFDPRDSLYLSFHWMPLASIIGGLCFGYGMALAGNCGFGALARAGGGDMRGFIIALVLGVSAYATLYGPLAGLRNWLSPQIVIADETPPGLAYLIGTWSGLPVQWIGLGIGLTLTALLLIVRHRCHSDAPALLWGTLAGLAIVAGWAGTTWVSRHSFAVVPVTSHNFSAPMGETLLYLMQSSVRVPSFALGSISGVIIGAFLGTLIRGHFRWEACEDPRELRRQMAGAALMGFGAAVALGCTIGQGITAFSVLSLSAPVTFLSIFAGAAIGLRQLIEGFRISD